MDQKKKKQLMLFLSSLFLAAVLIGSFTAFGNNNNNISSSTTTMPNVKTYVVFGTTNAVVQMFSDATSITTRSNSSATIVANTLSNLEAQGYVVDYVQSGNSFEALLTNYSAYTLQEQLINETNATANSLLVNSTTFISLPQSIPTTLNGAVVVVYPPTGNYLILLEPLSPPGTVVPIKFEAYITANGTVYQDQIRLSQVT